MEAVDVTLPVSRWGLALALCLVVACGGGSPASPALPSTVAQFDALWQDFDLTYPDFAGKGSAGARPGRLTGTGRRRP
jgi:hypothetical protein